MPLSKNGLPWPAGGRAGLPKKLTRARRRRRDSGGGCTFLRAYSLPPSLPSLLPPLGTSCAIKFAKLTFYYDPTGRAERQRRREARGGWGAYLVSWRVAPSFPSPPLFRFPLSCRSSLVLHLRKKWGPVQKKEGASSATVQWSGGSAAWAEGNLYITEKKGTAENCTFLRGLKVLK